MRKSTVGWLLTFTLWEPFFQFRFADLKSSSDLILSHLGMNHNFERSEVLNALKSFFCYRERVFDAKDFWLL